MRNYQRPIPAGQLPVYDLALEVLESDKRRVQEELKELIKDNKPKSAVEEKQWKQRIAQLEVLEGSNDPEVRYNFKNGIVDMSKAYYRYLSQKDFERQRLSKLMERLLQMKVIPDVVPPFTPSAELVVDFAADELAEKDSEKAVRPVIPGSYVRAGLSTSRPELQIKIFDAQPALYSLIIVDPDVPDAANERYTSLLHLLGANLKLSATTSQQDLNKQLDEAVVNYIPPHPAQGSGYHRYTVLLVKQDKEFIGEVDREGFSVREYVDSVQGVPVAGHMWRAVHDEDSSKVYAALGKKEPVYGHAKKESRYLL